MPHPNLGLTREEVKQAAELIKVEEALRRKLDMLKRADADKFKPDLKCMSFSNEQLELVRDTLVLHTTQTLKRVEQQLLHDYNVSNLIDEVV